MGRPKQTPPIPFPAPTPLPLDSVDNTADPGYPIGDDGYPILPDPSTPPPNSPVQDEYDPDSWKDWVISSTDRQGHKSDMIVQVMPVTAHQVSIAVASNRFPYRTHQDLLRHAIHRHLRFLAVFDKNMPSVMAQVDAMNMLLTEDQLLQEQQAVLGSMQSQVEKHLATGDLISAKRMIGSALNNIDNMPSGSWRDDYRHIFNELFGWAVEDISTVNEGGVQPQQSGKRRRRGGHA